MDFANLIHVNPLNGCFHAPLTLRRVWPVSSVHLLLEYQDALGFSVAAQAHTDFDFLQAEAHSILAITGRNPTWAHAADHSSVLLQPHGLDSRLPALHPFVSRPQRSLIAHRPGRRAVVSALINNHLRFCKFFSSSRKLRRALGQFSRLQACALPFLIPSTLYIDPLANCIHTAQMPGELLYVLLRNSPPRPLTALHIAQALKALHNSAAAITPNHDFHGAFQELAAVRRYLDALPDSAVSFSDSANLLFSSLANAALDVGSSTVSSIHRDFYDKQIFVSETSLGILDFDTLTPGHALVDICNFLAHLELRLFQFGNDASWLYALGCDFLRFYDQIFDEGDFQFFLDVSRLRLACVYYFRPRWTRLASRMLATVSSPFFSFL